MTAATVSPKRSSRAPSTAAQKSKNAQAVARFRDRRKVQLEQLTAENVTLKAQNEELQTENKALRDRAPGSTAPARLAQIEVDNYLLRRENEHMRALLEQCLLGQQGDVPRYNFSASLRAARDDAATAPLAAGASPPDGQRSDARAFCPLPQPSHAPAPASPSPHLISGTESQGVSTSCDEGDLGLDALLPELAGGVYGLGYAKDDASAMRSPGTYSQQSPGSGSDSGVLPPSPLSAAISEPALAPVKLEPHLSLERHEFPSPRKTDLLNHIALPAAVPPALIQAPWSSAPHTQPPAAAKREARDDHLVDVDWSMLLGVHTSGVDNSAAPAAFLTTPTATEARNRAGAFWASTTSHMRVPSVLSELLILGIPHLLIPRPVAQLLCLVILLWYVQHSPPNVA